MQSGSGSLVKLRLLVVESGLKYNCEVLVLEEVFFGIVLQVFKVKVRSAELKSKHLFLQTFVNMQLPVHHHRHLAVTSIKFI